MTKEELQKLNTRLEQSNEHYAKEDKRLRQEFAKAFGRYEVSYEITRKRDGEYLSWEEIFVEVGKLLSHWRYKISQEEFGALRMKVNEIKKVVFKENEEEDEDDEFDS